MLQHPPADDALSDQTRAEFAIFDRIEAQLRTKFGKVGGPKFIVALYDELWLSAFAYLLRNGSLRLPAAMGTFRLVRLRPGTIRKPDGTYTPSPPRVSIKFVEGDAMKMALGKIPRVSRRKKPPAITKLVRQFVKDQIAGTVALTEAEIDSLLTPKEK